jgi:hypothetical protein
MPAEQSEIEMSELSLHNGAEAAPMMRLPSARRPPPHDLGAPAATLGSAGLPGEIVVASLIDLDPSLARDLSPALREQARQWLAVRVCALPRGPWPGAVDEHEGTMGLLVLDGVLARNVSLGRIAYPELLGAGDLVRPWAPDVNGRLLHIDVDWHVIEPCRLAFLDRRFAGIVGRWPELVNELIGRALARARELDFNMAIVQLPLLELRLLALLWHLGERWGRDVDGGVLIPVRLTHTLLGAMVLGRRPSVSTALGELSTRGLVSRCDEGWLLHGAPPTDLHKLSRRDAGAAGGA